MVNVEAAVWKLVREGGFICQHHLRTSVQQLHCGQQFSLRCVQGLREKCP